MIELRQAIADGVDALGVEYAPIIWHLANADWASRTDYHEFLSALTTKGPQQ